MKTVQHICALAIITIIMGLVYVSVQQVYRTTANDPQIQLAHDISNRLNGGQSIDHYFDSDTLELNKTAAVFIEIYQSGQPVRSNALLNGSLPQIPHGVLDFASAKGEDRVTWQPLKGVRMAMVLVRLNTSPDTIVAVGRSLAEIENRVSGLTITIVICWILSIAIVGISWLSEYYLSRKRKMK